MRTTRHHWQISVKHPLTKRWRKHSVVPLASAKYVAQIMQDFSKEWLGVKADKLP